MKEVMDRSKGDIVVLVPETTTERRVLVQLIQDAIREKGIMPREFPVFTSFGPGGGPSDRKAHFYLFASDPDEGGWFKAVIDVDHTLMEIIGDGRQIPGVLGVILDGRGFPTVTFYATEEDRSPAYDPLRGTLRPSLTLADFGIKHQG